VPRVHLGDRMSIGTEGTICLDRPGTVELTGVTPVRPQGLRVTGFAVRPNQYWKPTGGVHEFLGEQRAPLRKLGFASRTVDAACDRKTGAGYELAFRVLKTGPGEAAAAGLTLTYTADGHTGTLAIPFAVRLCPEKSASAKACNSLTL
jgi:hypothetical protein